MNEKYFVHNLKYFKEGNKSLPIASTLMLGSTFRHFFSAPIRAFTNLFLDDSLQKTRNRRMGQLNARNVISVH
jgi:hypothetical protein